MTKRLKVYCPYSVLDLDWVILKNLKDITFEKPWYLKRNNNDRQTETSNKNSQPIALG